MKEKTYMELWKENQDENKYIVDHLYIFKQMIEDIEEKVQENQAKQFTRFKIGSKSKMIGRIINSCIDSYLQSQICIDSYIVSGSDNSSNNYISSSICGESGNSSKNVDARTSDQIIRKSSTNLNVTQKYRHLWVQCENCYGLNYKKFFKPKMNLCEQCGYHLKMSSSDRIELSIDPGTWELMDEYMVSLDPIEFHSEDEPYKNRIDSYQGKTGLTRLFKQA
ncbi:hypothetical protein R6Q57_006273 [Mikania cordata]